MPLKAEALRGNVFHSANCVKVFGHFADCFVVNKIYCLELNTERILNIIHKAHCVKRAHPEIKALVTAPDGNIYSTPYVQQGEDGTIASNMMINVKWLEKLGLDVSIEDSAKKRK